MYLRTRSYKTGQKINKKKLIISASILAALILIIVGIIILASSGRDLKNSIYKAPFGARNKIITQNDGFLYTDSDNLIYTDYLSKQIWSKKMFSQEVSTTASEQIIAVYNKKNIQLFDMSGNQLSSKEITGSILNVCCAKDKVAIITEVQTEEAGLKKALTVYNTKGEKIDDIPLETQNIIDIGFYGKNYLWILTLDTDGVVPISKIATYEPGVSQKGIININGQLIQKLIIDESSIYASGTTNLIIYSILGEKKDSYLIYGWNFHGQFYVDKKPLFLYIPKQKEDKSFDSLRLLNPGKSNLTINLPPGIIKATIYNDKIYCFSKKNIYKYSLEGKREDQYNLPYSIDSVSKIYGKYAFLVKGPDVFILPLP